MQEALKRFSLQQPAQRVDLILRCRLGIQITAFNPVQQPRTHFRVVNVHELKARLAAIIALQFRQHRFQLHRLPVAEQVRLHILLQLVRRESQARQRQPGHFRSFLVQRIQMRGGVAQRTEALQRVRNTHAKIESLL